MIDLVSKEVYHYSEKLDMPAKKLYFVMAIAAVSSIILVVITGGRLANPHLYFQQLSITLKILITVGGVLAGLLLSLCIKRNKYEFKLEEFLNKYPDAKKCEAKEAINKAFFGVLLVLVFNIGFLLSSIWLYILFFANNNLGTYIWATLSFIIFSLISLTFRSNVTIVWMKFTKEYKSIS